MRVLHLTSQMTGHAAQKPENSRFPKVEVTRLRMLPAHVMERGWSVPGEVGRGETVVAWSGGMAEGLFDAEPRTWSGPGWVRLRETCDRLRPALRERGLRLLLRTHARHVLADVTAAATFLSEQPERDGEESALGVLVDIGAMFERSMLATAEEHLRRMLSGALALGAAEGIVLSNLREGDASRGARGDAESVGADDADDVMGQSALEWAAWHDAGGLIDPKLLARAWREYVLPAGVPVIFADGHASGSAARPGADGRGDLSGQVGALADALVGD